MSTGEILHCHRQSEWTEESTRDFLLGRWRLEYIASFWEPKKDSYTWSREFIIDFRSDSTLFVVEKGDTTQTAHWHIIKGEKDYYEIESDPRISELYGRILFCDDLVEFYATYEDLLDHYFRKIE